jgi:hypothetical protein
MVFFIQYKKSEPKQTLSEKKKLPQDLKLASVKNLSALSIKFQLGKKNFATVIRIKHSIIEIHYKYYI